LLFIDSAQLVQDGARSVLIKAAESPVRLLHRRKTLLGDEAVGKCDSLHIRVDLPDHAAHQGDLLAARYRIVMPRADEAVAVGVIKFFVIEGSHARHS
jgi:hypothetical protein